MPVAAPFLPVRGDVGTAPSLGELANEYAAAPAWERASPSRKQQLFYDALAVNDDLRMHFEDTDDQQAVVDSFFKQLNEQKPDIKKVSMGETEETVREYLPNTDNPYPAAPMYKERKVKKKHSRDILPADTELSIARLKGGQGVEQLTPDSEGVTYDKMLKLMPVIRLLRDTGELDASTAETWHQHAALRHVVERQGISPDDPKFASKVNSYMHKIGAKSMEKGFLETFFSLSPVISNMNRPGYKDEDPEKRGHPWSPSFRIPVFNEGVDVGILSKEENQLFEEIITPTKLMGGLVLPIGGGMKAAGMGMKAAQQSVKAKGILAGETAIAAETKLLGPAMMKTATGQKAALEAGRVAAHEYGVRFGRELTKNPEYVLRVLGAEAMLAGAMESGTGVGGIVSHIAGLEPRSWQSRIATTAEAVLFVAAIDSAIRGLKGVSADKMLTKYTDISTLLANPNRLKGMSIRKAFESIDDGKLAAAMDRAAAKNGLMMPDRAAQFVQDHVSGVVIPGTRKFTEQGAIDSVGEVSEANSLLRQGREHTEGIEQQQLAARQATEADDASLDALRGRMNDQEQIQMRRDDFAAAKQEVADGELHNLLDIPRGPVDELSRAASPQAHHAADVDSLGASLRGNQGTQGPATNPVPRDYHAELQGMLKRETDAGMLMDLKGKSVADDLVASLKGNQGTQGPAVAPKMAEPAAPTPAPVPKAPEVSAASPAVKSADPTHPDFSITEHNKQQIIKHAPTKVEDAFDSAAFADRYKGVVDELIPPSEREIAKRSAATTAFRNKAPGKWRNAFKDGAKEANKRIKGGETSSAMPEEALNRFRMAERALAPDLSKPPAGQKALEERIAKGNQIALEKAAFEEGWQHAFDEASKARTTKGARESLASSGEPPPPVPAPKKAVPAAPPVDPVNLSAQIGSKLDEIVNSIKDGSHPRIAAEEVMGESVLRDVDLFDEALSEAVFRSGKAFGAKSKMHLKLPESGHAQFDAKPSTVAKKKDMREAALPAVSKDKERYMIGVVHVEGENIIATNGRMLVKLPNDGGLPDGDFKWLPASKKWKKEEVNFPNWKIIWPDPDKLGRNSDLIHVKEHHAHAPLADVPIKDILGQVKRMNASSKNFSGDPAPLLMGQGSKGEVSALNPALMEQALTSLGRSGAKKISLHSVSMDSPVLMKGDNGAEALIMPIRGDNDKHPRGFLLRANQGEPTSLGFTPHASPAVAARELATQVGGGFVAEAAIETEDETMVDKAGQFMLGFMAPVSAVGTLGIRQGGKRVGAFLNEMLMPKGRLPAKVFRGKMVMEGSIKAHLSDMNANHTKLQKHIKAHYKVDWHDLDDATMARYNEFLQGGSAAGIDVGTQTHLKRMRDHVDKMTDLIMRDAGIPDELKIELTKNKGVYLHRSYKVHDMPGYAGKVPENVRDAAKAHLMGDLGYTSEHADGVINQMLSHDGASDVMQNIQALQQKAGDILKKRNNKLHPSILALLGEYKNPVVNYTKSVTKMANFLEHAKLMEQTRQWGDGVFLFKEATGEFAHQIPVGKNHPLHGLFTTKPLSQALKTLEEVRWNFGGPAGWVYQQFLKTKAWTQIGKTVYSPATHVRNFLGNTVMVASQGHLSALGAFAIPFASAEGRAARKVLLNEMGGGSDDALREQYKEYLRMGLVGTSAQYGDMKSILSQISVTRLSAAIERIAQGKGVAGKTLRGVKKVHQFSATAYQMEDDFWKIWTYKQELARYKKALPNASDDQLKEMAKEAVLQVLPNYAYVPKGIKHWRQMPLGNFTSFPYEIIRTSVNTARLAAKEMGQEATRSIGMQRMASFLGIGMLASGTIAATSRKLFGVSKENDQDVRRFTPPWQERSQLVYFKELGDLFNVADLTYTDPYEYIKKPIVTALGLNKADDEDMLNVAIAGAVEFAKPFVGPSIAGRTLKDATSNRTSYGSEIYNPQDNWNTKLGKTLTYVWNQTEPGVVSQFQRFWDAGTGKGSPPRSIENEAAGLAMGFRVVPYAIKDQAAYRWGGPDGAVAKMRENSRLFTQVAKSYKHPSREKITKAFVAANRNHYGNQQEIFRDIVALRRSFKISDKDIYSIMLEQRIPKSTAKALLRGVFVPIKLSNQTAKDAIRERKNDVDVPVIRDIARQLYGIPITQPFPDL
jgi:hypothetical protein